MSVVDRIELFIAETPLPASWKPAWVPGQTRNTQRNFLIRITTDDGVEGWSAMVAWGRDRVGIGNMIAFLFLGRDPTDIELVHDQLHIVSMFGHREGWIEPAFWDIKGKLAGKPVCTLLGGGPCTLELYASAGELKSPAERIEEAEARLAEGFRVLKVRVHDFDEARDIEQVVEPARAMAGRMQLAVDCNQAFRFDFLAKSPRWDLARAKRFVDAVEDCGLAWIEEPQFMERFDDMAEIARYARTPIAGGELHWAGYPELAHMVKQGCYDIFQPDALWVGGIKTCHELAQLCAAHGRSFTPHTWNHGIGFAANMQVLAGTNFAGKVLLEYPIAPPGWTPEGRDFLLTEPFLHDRGRITVPDRPGLGFEIDRAALDQYAVKYFEATRKSLVWMPEKLMPWGQWRRAASRTATREQRVYWPQGRLLGGSSSINAMVYMRGQPEDFDAWRELGNPGWGWSDVLPYFKKSEDNASGAGEYHGVGGPLGVSDFQVDRHPITDRFIEAAQQAGLPRNDDFNGPSQEGVGLYQLTVRDGVRSSAATAFLAPARRRSNLRVLTRASATRVLFDGKRASGVSYRRGEAEGRVLARREVILAAGAIGSPQLLQLSGVGPADHLRRCGVEPHSDSPAVGRNLQDHLQTGLYFTTTIPTLNDQLHPWWGKLRVGLRYVLFRRGPVVERQSRRRLRRHRAGEPPPGHPGLLHADHLAQLVGTDEGGGQSGP